MQSNKSLHPRARLSSFGYAIRGIGSLVLQEPNAVIHAIITVAVIAFGLVLHISRMEWAGIAIAIALVWMAEAFNTCIEMLCDLWCKGEYHPKVKRIKDIAAAAVLITSIIAMVVGALVFLPHFL